MSSSMHCALAILQVDGGAPLRCIYPGHPKDGEQFQSAKKPNGDGAWAVYVVNATTNIKIDVTEDRVGCCPQQHPVCIMPMFTLLLQASKYMDSLDGKLPKGTTVKSFNEKLQTLHRIQVLCPDSELTKDNYCVMMRCDCKGYYKAVQCCHVHALAHWWVHALVCSQNGSVSLQV